MKPAITRTGASQSRIRELQNYLQSLRSENAHLREENDRLKHPGTSSLAAILRYPLQANDANIQKKPTKRKTFTFARVLTGDEAMATARALQEGLARLDQEKQQKKEERARKKAEREAEQAQKTQTKERKEEEN